MFHHKDLLTDGRQASAVITGLTPCFAASTINAGASDEEYSVRNPKAGQLDAYVFQARVTFEDGATQDVTFRTTLAEWSHPHGASDRFGGDARARFASLDLRLRPRNTVPVRYDSAHRNKIVLDLPALRQQIDQGTQSGVAADAKYRPEAVPPGPDDAAPEASPPPDFLDVLTQLAELHDRGVLTDSEFDAQKQKLLDD